MTAVASSVAGRAIQRIANLGYSHEFAELVVDTVLEELADPDSHMVAGGRAELDMAFGTADPRGAVHRRELIRVIWHTMLDRSR